MKKIAVFLANGFEEVEAITPIDYLRRAGVEVAVVGVTGGLVTGGHGIAVQPDLEITHATAEMVSGLDGVIIPGGTGGAEGIAASDLTMEIIKQCLDAGKMVAAICAAPGIVLGANGLLAGRRFTCYPGFESRVVDGTFSEERVVVDQNIITSRGAGSAAEFAFAVIEYLVGQESARSVSGATLQPV